MHDRVQYTPVMEEWRPPGVEGEVKKGGGDNEEEKKEEEEDDLESFLFHVYEFSYFCHLND